MDAWEMDEVATTGLTMREKRICLASFEIDWKRHLIIRET